MKKFDKSARSTHSQQKLFIARKWHPKKRGAPKKTPGGKFGQQNFCQFFLVEDDVNHDAKFCGVEIFFGSQTQL